MGTKFIPTYLASVRSGCRCFVPGSHLILLGTLLSIAPTFADEDRFDGSQFNPESFMGMNFNKQIYGNLPYKSAPEQRMYRDDTDSAALRMDSDRDLIIFDRDVMRAGDDRKEIHLLENGYGSIPTLTRDWVPDVPDLTSNGGFSIAPFNGTPVPYSLNGFVDLQH